MEKLEKFLEKYQCNRWLLPALVILFVLQMVTMPFVVNVTYADRPYAPEHQLTYNMTQLTWDQNTHINAYGVAEMDLFDAVYSGVRSRNGRNVIAPGTQGESSVRLVNKAHGPVEYIVVLYEIKTNEALPVTPVMYVADETKPTDEFILPPGVHPSQVLQSRTGTVSNGSKVDIGVHWNWEFYESDAQDVIDTALGNAGEDSIIVGLYIVVVDNNDYSLPKTGDESHFGAYLTMMCVSGALLVLLLLEKRKERSCESSNQSDESSASV